MGRSVINVLLWLWLFAFTKKLNINSIVFNYDNLLQFETYIIHVYMWKSGEKYFMKRNLISSYENKFLNSRIYFYLDFISHYKSDSNHNHLVDDSVAFTAVISDSLKEIMILCFPFMFLWYFPIRRQDFYFITELLGRIFFGHLQMTDILLSLLKM